MLPQVSINYLAHEIDFLRPKFEKIFYLWREGKINNGETCSLYLLTFLISRFGNHTFGGFRKRKSGLTISPQTTRQSISKDQLLSLLNIPLRVIAKYLLILIL